MKPYDRRTQDIGNIVLLEHINLQVPDPGIATEFYVVGLGLTRDPYLRVGNDNMWINIGKQQFHLPTGNPQRFRGTIGLVMADLDALAIRLDRARDPLANTRFGFKTGRGRVDITCPWGNRICIHENVSGFAARQGLAYLESPVPKGSAKTIGAFYGACMGSPAKYSSKSRRGEYVEVCAGPGQRLIYRESKTVEMNYDGHHLAIYVADFSGPHKWLKSRGLITTEDSEYQYRFEDLVGPKKGQKSVWSIEHEVRCLHHPHWQRPLVNRS